MKSNEIREDTKTANLIYSEIKNQVFIEFSRGYVDMSTYQEVKIPFYDLYNGYDAYPSLMKEISYEDFLTFNA